MVFVSEDGRAAWISGGHVEEVGQRALPEDFERVRA